ncbi:MAG: hypothetical protein U1D55_16015 [Phycisphaerae bacterium]
MTRFTHPRWWFPAGLLALWAAAAVVLSLDACVREESRDPRFAARHAWQAAFDGLCAASGCGLLTFRFDADYTPIGRAALAGAALVGAGLFVAAAAQAARQTGAFGPLFGAPHPLACVGGMLVVQALVCAALIPVFGSDATLDVAVLGVTSFCGLGVRGDLARAAPLALCVVGWIGAAGWPLWLLALPAARRVTPPARLATWIAAQLALVCIAGMLMAALESPRGAATPGRFTAEANSRTSLLMAAGGAGGAGMSTIDPRDAGLHDGTLALLAILVLIGGAALSPAGGVSIAIVLAAAGFSRLRGESDPDAGRARQFVALRLAGAAALLTLVVAIGLLALENRVASPFAARPTFAAALLDAASAVGGAGLSGGLADSVTDRNLVSGMRQSGGADQANLYPIGMSWLMLAMLAGRMMPIMLLNTRCRA